MRVLLVNTNRSRDLVPPPPLGIAYVASAAADAGHEVAVLDLLVHHSAEGALRRAIRAQRPEVIGFSVRNLDNLVQERVLEHLGPVSALVDLARRESPAAVVIGGSAVSMVGTEARRRLRADYAVVGEGEQAFVELLAALETGRDGSGIAGVIGSSDDAAIPPRTANRFGRSGMERWVEWRNYEALGSTWGIQSKRGCQRGCSYCRYGPIEGGIVRLREPGDVVDEIEKVARIVAPRTFEFVDSTFNLPPAHAFALCEEIVSRRIRADFTAQGVNPLGASVELLSVMARAGFNSFMVSPEAGSDVMLARLRKGFTMDDVHRTRDAAAASPMTSLWFFMLGGPGETEATLEATVSFAERQLDWDRCVAIFITGVRLLPGTEVTRIAIEEGQIAADHDLSRPSFYFSREVSHERAMRRVREAIHRRPNIVHAAEESGATQFVMGRVANLLRLAPPYWRFLPRVLRCAPMRLARRLQPDLDRSA